MKMVKIRLLKEVENFSIYEQQSRVIRLKATNKQPPLVSRIIILWVFASRMDTRYNTSTV